MKPVLIHRFCWAVLLGLAASLQITAGYYDPGIQRWINRDPFAEQGGANLYALLENQVTHGWDAFGHGPCEDQYEAEVARARALHAALQDLITGCKNDRVDPALDGLAQRCNDLCNAAVDQNAHLRGACRFTCGSLVGLLETGAWGAQVAASLLNTAFSGAMMASATTAYERCKAAEGGLAPPRFPFPPPGKEF